MGKRIILALTILLLSFSDIYSQTVIWKLEAGNTSSGLGDNAGRSVSVFGGTSEISSNTIWSGSAQYVYVWANNWIEGSGTKGFKLTVKSLHFQGLAISYSHTSDDVNDTIIGPRDFKLQYSLNDISYYDVPDGTEALTGDSGFESCITKTNLPLPAACNNKNQVYLRWIMTSNSGVKDKVITEAGQSKLANIEITGTEVPIPPSDIELSDSTAVPGAPAGTGIGTFTVTDLNYADTFTYSLVSGQGDIHNSLFQISGDRLQNAALLSPGTYYIRVNVFDGTYNYAEIFTIYCDYMAPEDIILSSDRVITTDPPGTIVGTLTTIDSNGVDLTFTYSLVDGEGSTHNSMFAISGDKLLTGDTLSAGTYLIRVNVNNGFKDYSEVFAILALPPATIWNGLRTTFTKADYADWTLPENQDTITPMVSITRANSRPIFNIKTENSATGTECDIISPAGTEWALGTTDSIQYLVFDTFINTVGCNPSEAVGLNMVLHLIDENIYIDIKLLSWTAGADKGGTGGGGFSYERATNTPLPVELTSFTASAANGKIRLDWTTATEVDNYGFEVERQNSARPLAAMQNPEWNKIGFVKGYGSSNSPKAYTFEDKLSAPGKYSYRLKQIDNDGKFEYSNAVDAAVFSNEYSLSQNYPNPCNPSAVISFSIPENVHVTLKVYDMIGREIKTLVNEKRDAGEYSVKFEAGNLASGIYLYKLTAGRTSITRKMILLR